MHPIWFGSKGNLKKIADLSDLDLNLYIGADVINPVSVVRDLGVFLDSKLSMCHHINTVVLSLVTRVTATAKLTYACSAWWRYLDSSGKAHPIST